MALKVLPGIKFAGKNSTAGPIRILGTSNFLLPTYIKLASSSSTKTGSLEGSTKGDITVRYI
jgi:hypothetical protein